MTKVRIKPRILDVVEDDGMWLDQSTLTYYSKEDVEEVDLSRDLEKAADSAAIKAFPENKSYSTVVDRVVDYSAIDRKNYHDGFIAGGTWKEEQLMKNAKDGWVDEECVIVLNDGTRIDLQPDCEKKPAFEFEYAQDVRVIVLPKED